LWIALFLPPCAVIGAGGADFDWRRICVSDTLSLYVKDRNVGTLYHAIIVDSQGLCIRERKDVRVFGGAAPGAMRMVEVREYSIKGDLQSAIQVLESPSGTTTWKLSVQPDGEGELAVTAGGETSKRRVGRVVSNARTTYDIQTAVLDKRSVRGRVWLDTMFDLMSGKHITARTTCISPPSKPGDTWVFSTLDNTINREERWEVDQEGKTVLMEVAPIFTARRQTASGNAAGEARDGAVEIAGQFLVKMDKAPSRGEAVELMLDEGVNLHESVAPMYDKRPDGWLRLQAAACACNDAADGTAQAADSLWLRHTPVVQTNAEKIRARASELTEGEKRTRCAMAGAFNDYVFRAIEKRNVATFSNALETLQAGFGDCGEHAVLLAALLRAAGIPAKVLFGLVYIVPKKGFMYHAWVQAKIGGVWLNADPALGDFPSCRPYVPLLIDDTGEGGISLANCIDRVRIRYSSR